jgi:hypothetical protein
MKLVIFAAASAAVWLLAAPAFADPQCSPHDTSDTRATDPDQIMVMIDAKTAMKEKLDDVHASFRDVYFCKTPRDQISMACGEVKSSRTGKSYVRFLSGGRADMTSYEGDGKTGFDSAWDRFCKP